MYAAFVIVGFLAIFLMHHSIRHIKLSNMRYSMGMSTLTAPNPTHLRILKKNIIPIKIDKPKPLLFGYSLTFLIPI